MNIDSDKLLEWIKHEIEDIKRESVDAFGNGAITQLKCLRDAIQSGELAAKRGCVLDGLSAEEADIVRDAIKNEALRLREQIEAENNGCPNFCTGGIIYQGRQSYPCPNCTAA